MLTMQSSERQSAVFAFPTAADMLTLCRMEGPCVSIFLGPHVAGSGTKASGAALLAMLPRIEESLKDWGLEPAEMLQPVEAMAKEPPFTLGHRDALCIFLSREALHCFSAHTAVETAWHVEERCVVIPVLEHLDYRQSFLLLALAGKHVRLLRCEGGTVTALAIPDGVPESAGEFIGDLRDEEASRNHAPGVKFGSSEPREKGPHFRRDFMKAIDRGLLPLLRSVGLPLVLAGVPEETAAYASVSEYAELVEEPVKMSPDGGVTETELIAAGADVMKRWCSPAERQALADYENAGMRRRRGGFAAILQAARAGKIQHLFVERGTLATAVNSSVVEVLLHKGMVWLAVPERMPDASVMAAVLRYADES